MPSEHSEVVVGIDVGTTGVKGIAVAPTARLPRSPSTGTRCRRPTAAGRSRTRRTGGARRRSCSGRWGRSSAAPGSWGSGLSGQMHGLVALDNADTGHPPGDPWNDQRTGAECAEIEERIGLERLIALTGNRALTGFTAPKLLWLRRNEPDAYHRIARIMLPRTTSGSGSRASGPSTSPTRRGRCSSTLPPAPGRTRCSTPSSCRPDGCRLSSNRPRSRASRSPAAPSRQGFRSLQGRATARPPRSASGSTARAARDRDGYLGRRVRRAASTRRIRRRASTRSATRFPASGTRWA